MYEVMDAPVVKRVKKKNTDNLMLRNACKLTRDEEAHYVKLYKDGDNEAAGTLIESQIAWMYALVRRHNLPRHIDFDDIISELCIVLLKALKNFDPSRTALTTFVATIVIRRTRRIARKLAGPIKYQDVGDSFPLIVEESGPDEWMETVLDAIVTADMVPAAQVAVCMHLAGIRDEAIYEHLVTNYSCGEKLDVKKLIASAVDCVRSKARELGLEMPEYPLERNAFFAT